MQEMQDPVEQTSKSGILYECDCHYGLSNVNPQNTMGYCLELLLLESISHGQSLLPQPILFTAASWLLCHKLLKLSL